MSFKKKTLGEHVLYWGDCLEVMQTLESKSIDMILADLPYGVTARNKWDEIIPFKPLWKQYERIIKDNGAMVFTASQPFATTLVSSNPKLFRYDLIWEKEMGSGHLNANRMPLRSHESILVFYKKLPIYNPQFENGKPYVATSGEGSTNYNEQIIVTTISDGKRYPKSVLRFNRDKEKLHPTQKPIALLEWLIKTYTIENEVILDNVMGSGSTGEACIKTNRRFIGIEKEIKYFKMAYERLLPLVEL